jgi:hypothetical protein
MEDSNAFFFVFLPFPTHFLSHLVLPPLFVFTWWCLGLPKCTLSVSGLFGPVFFKSSLLGPRYFSFFSLFFLFQECVVFFFLNFFWCANFVMLLK